MNTMPRSKDRSRSEIEKLREMDFREKLEYVWSYYKYHIISGCAALAILISLLATCRNNPEIGLFIEWNACYITQEDFDAMTSKLEKRLFDDESGQIVQGSFSFIINDDLAFMAQHYEKTLAMLAAGVLDVFILNREFLNEYSYMEYLLPLKDTLAVVESDDPALYERIEPEIVYAPYGGYEQTALGIRITDSSLFSGLAYDLYEDVYFCAAVTTRNIDNVKCALMEYFS